MRGRAPRQESLSAGLSRIVLPLSAIVALLLAVGAPFAWFLLTFADLRSRTGLAARHVAREMESFVEESPGLWMYNSPKVAGYFKEEYEGEAPFHVEVLDGAGRSAYRFDPRTPPYVWHSANIASRSGAGGKVVVGLSTRRLLITGLLLLCGFTVLGCGLAGLLYLLPMRVLRRAETRLTATLKDLSDAHGQLEEANVDLERRVHEKTRGLEEARDQLAGQQAQLRHLAATSFAAQEEERHRISRDLHDSVGQVLTAIRLNLERTTLLLEAAPSQDDKLADLVLHTCRLVDDTTDSIRRSIHALGEPLLQDGGLAGAAAALVTRFEHSACKITLEAASLSQDLPPAVEVCAFRVLQEALTNALRHADASSIVARISEEARTLLVVVTDDGSWDEALGRDPGLGLSNMRDRVSLLGGNLELLPSGSGGTRLEARIPTRPSQPHDTDVDQQEESGDP